MPHSFPVPYVDRVLAVAAITALEITAVVSLSEFRLQIAFDRLLNGTAQSAISKELTSASPLASFAIPAIGALKYAVFRQGTGEVYVGREGWLFTTEELELHPNAQSVMARNADRVLEAHSLLSERGIKVLPILVPDKAEIYGKQLGFKQSEALLNRRRDFSAELLARRVPFWDSSSALALASENRQVFMKDDTHWSPFGAQVVAETTTAIVHQMNVNLSKATVSTIPTGTIEFDGDLLPFVPTGAARNLLGPEQSLITTYETTVDAAGGLFGDAAPEVALVGTSFSDRNEFNFLGFLQQSLAADVVSFAQSGRGPFEPMEDFLASDFLADTPPKVVIWEIPVRYVTKENML